jgi:hypothetical protein
LGCDRCDGIGDASESGGIGTHCVGV